MHSKFETQKPRAWRPPPPDPQFGQIILNYEDLKELGIAYSKEHLRRLEAVGQFPERVRLTPNRVVWSLDEVVAWINDRVKTRGEAHHVEKQDDK